MTINTIEVDDGFTFVEFDPLAPYANELRFGAKHLLSLHPELSKNAEVICALADKYGPQTLRLADPDLQTSPSFKATVVKGCSQEEAFLRICVLIEQSVIRIQRRF